MTGVFFFNKTEYLSTNDQRCMYVLPANNQFPGELPVAYTLTLYNEHICTRLRFVFWTGVVNLLFDFSE